MQRESEHLPASFDSKVSSYPRRRWRLRPCYFPSQREAHDPSGFSQWCTVYSSVPESPRFAAGVIKTQAAGMLRRKDEQLLRDHILPKLGKIKLVDLTTAHAVRLARALLKRRAPNTVSCVIGTLRVVCRDAAVDGLISANPITLPRGVIPGKQVTIREIYQPGEVDRLLTCHRVPRHVRVMLALAFFTGMRRGEVCGRRCKWASSRQSG